jgi:hypothetical protein
MAGEPRMVEGDVVRDEVDQQPHATIGERGPGRGQTRAPAEAGIDLVATDAVRGPEQVRLVEVGQDGTE